VFVALLGNQQRLTIPITGVEILMIIKQRLSSPMMAHPAVAAQGLIWDVSPCTPEERLQRIESLAQGILAHVKFMCGSGPGQMSAEAKEKALAAFYEGMIVAERHLGKIHDAFLLV
jgi:hypothetical protein